MKGHSRKKRETARSAEDVVSNSRNATSNKTVFLYKLDCALLTPRLYSLAVCMQGCVLCFSDSITICHSKNNSAWAHPPDTVWFNPLTEPHHLQKHLPAPLPWRSSTAPLLPPLCPSSAGKLLIIPTSLRSRPTRSTASPATCSQCKICALATPATSMHFF